MNRFHDHLRAWYAYAKGWRIYVVAVLLALPDMLDALAGVDVNAILPDWMPGAKFSAWLALARIFVGITIRRLPPPPEETSQERN
jgi:hypothetical protein